MEELSLEAQIPSKSLALEGTLGAAGTSTCIFPELYLKLAARAVESSDVEDVGAAALSSTPTPLARLESRSVSSRDSDGSTDKSADSKEVHIKRLEDAECPS